MRSLEDKISVNAAFKVGVWTPRVVCGQSLSEQEGQCSLRILRSRNRLFLGRCGVVDCQASTLTITSPRTFLNLMIS